jgi:valyl-tRNA synthetase
MLGDTAVAVHPEDERYASLIGRTVLLPLTDRAIPIIADTYVDKDFGTGVVKITPAHDPNDFEVGLRHGLQVLNVMPDDARMNGNAGRFEGLDRYAARKLVVEELTALGVLVKTEPHKHNVGHCYRCSTTVDPRVSFQWFVSMKSLAEPAIEAVRDGRTSFIPERFDKIYFNWMENIRDWCISRQLWWGHRIPAYYCKGCGEIVVGKEMPERCPVCGGTVFEQDPDTLDTWFSSALWPFSTLGWPENTPELQYFYPTSVLVTGYDIIFFWVARMIFSALEQTGQVPFPYVFIHGIVRDEKGLKMSKSLGNGIDPLEIIDRSGADALRYSLITGNSPGNDQRFLPIKVEAGRNFANKIWNAFRFVMMNMGDVLDFDGVDSGRFTAEDRWILTRLNRIVADVSDNLERFEIGVALAKLYSFIWEEFCDWYIEMVKPRLFDADAAGRTEALYVLNLVLSDTMKLLHPYMPFLTEEIYGYLIGSDASIMVSRWPQPRPEVDFPDEIGRMELLMDAIRKIRNIRTNMNVPPSRKAAIILVTHEGHLASIFSSAEAFMERLASVSEVRIQEDRTGIADSAVTAVIDGGEIFIPLGDLIDVAKEIARLEEESMKLTVEIDRVDTKLANEEFVSRAPEKVVNNEKEKRQKYAEMKVLLGERIAALRKDSVV